MKHFGSLVKKFLSGANAHRLVGGIPSRGNIVSLAFLFATNQPQPWDQAPRCLKCFQDSLEVLGSKTVKKFSSGAKAHRLGRDIPQWRNSNFNSLQFFPPRHSHGPGMKHRDPHVFLGSSKDSNARCFEEVFIRDGRLKLLF